VSTLVSLDLLLRGFDTHLPRGLSFFTRISYSKKETDPTAVSDLEKWFRCHNEPNRLSLRGYWWLDGSSAEMDLLFSCGLCEPT